MTTSGGTAPAPSAARRSLFVALLAALALAFVLFVALRAPERVRIVELPRPLPRPLLLDVPPMSPAPVPVRQNSPKH